MDRISIRCICRDLLRNCWLILLAMISALMVISVYQTVVYIPEYTSTATMVVSAKGSGSSGALANLSTTSEMASVFQDVFQSNILEKKVQEDLGNSNLNISISAEVIPETNLLLLNVIGENPREVYQAMKSVLKKYPEVSEYLFSNAVLEVLQSPQVPYAPSNELQLRQVQKIGVVVSAGLMMVVIILISVLRRTVKTEKAAKKFINGNCLATIGHEEKNRTLKARLHNTNKAILITNPVTSFGYVESFRKLAFRIRYEMDERKQKTLLISSVGENEGKSTIAANIALALVQSGKSVILIDMDLRCPALYKVFDKRQEGSGHFWREKIAVGKHNLFLILNKKSVKNMATYLKSSQISESIEQAKKVADYVILDSSPLTVGADAELLNSYVDASLLVVRQDWSHVDGINRSIDILAQNDTNFLGYVLNNFENEGFFGGRQYQYGYGSKYRHDYGGYQNNEPGRDI